MKNYESKKGNILITEDDLRGREELAEMLEIYGYTVYKAKSGKQAVTKISKNMDKFDIILMDINMPGQMDGIEAVRRIQTINRKIPIIFVTAYADDQVYRQKVKGEKLKIAGWVDKPIIGDNEKNLIDLVEKEIKKQIIRVEIEAMLQKDFSAADLEFLLEKLISLHGVDLMVEIVEDIEWIYPGTQIGADVLFPYLNYIAYKDMKNELEEKYTGQLIAFFKGKPIGHNKKRDDLVKSVYQTHGRTDLYITESNLRAIKFRHSKKIIHQSFEMR